LKAIRELLPADKSISIAAPALYWYLKGFYIAEMAETLHYIVYMTYDLHGQWDYDNTWVNPGCPNGNCLLSHVNLTETEYALARITKAGVPANKIAVRITSYSGSLGMENPTCTGPHCLFTGPDSAATKGDCTATSGYISQAELEQLVSSSPSLRWRDVASWYDSETDSDIMT
jgi:GH18 family chitinase